jgi:hypothetical protein
MEWIIFFSTGNQACNEERTDRACMCHVCGKSHPAGIDQWGKKIEACRRILPLFDSCATNCPAAAAGGPVQNACVQGVSTNAGRLLREYHQFIITHEQSFRNPNKQMVFPWRVGGTRSSAAHD